MFPAGMCEPHIHQVRTVNSIAGPYMIYHGRIEFDWSVYKCQVRLQVFYWEMCSGCVPVKYTTENAVYH